MMYDDAWCEEASEALTMSSPLVPLALQLFMQEQQVHIPDETAAM